jgi:EAL domain-containing protein (putative c-di-GMP-specific phosphodiesterase class I)
MCVVGPYADHPTMVRHLARGVSAQWRVAHEALEPEALRIVFQPIVASPSGHCCAFEALARFPRLGMAPDVVFAAARARGVGHELEVAAIRQALSVPDRPEGTGLCVNVSPSLLGSQSLWAAIPDTLVDIAFEITEHELCPNAHLLTPILIALRERGALIAVDDVGAGYAGLSQLVKVQPDIIKVDRVLIAGIHADNTRLALIAGLVCFADRSGAELWAEGVEDVADLEALVGLGVHAVQGFLLGRPGAPWIAPARLPDLLASSRRAPASDPRPFQVR